MKIKLEICLFKDISTKSFEEETHHRNNMSVKWKFNVLLALSFAFLVDIQFSEAVRIGGGQPQIRLKGNFLQNKDRQYKG